MDLERLEAALRAAHAAGDTAAAARFAAEIRNLQTQQAAPQQAAPAPAAPQQVASAPAAPQQAQPTDAQRRILEMQARLGPAPNTPIPEPQQAAPTPAPAEPPSLRERATAAAQGFGSGMFGVGTPLTAAAIQARAMIPGGEAPVPAGEAIERAREIRRTAEEENPLEFYSGMGASMVGGVGLVRAGAKALPKVASVFTPQAKQTARNIARLAAAGGTAAGVTAANEQGAEAVPGAVAIGAAAGPAVAGVVGGAAAIGRGVHSRISPDNAAIRLLARRLGEPVQAIADRFNEFVQTTGKAPRLVEIMRRGTAEEMGQIGRARSGAGEIFQAAEETAALQRPEELASLVRRGGATTSEAAQEALLPRPADAASRLRGPRVTETEARQALEPIREEAVESVGRRVQSTETAQIGRRDVQFDRLMDRVGTHRVPLTNDMLEVIQEPDIWNSLDPALRRRVGAAIEHGENIGSVEFNVRTWDAIRQELGAKAGAGAGQIYGRLRDRVTDYVSNAVPEYGSGLKEFGRRTDVARGTTAGRRALREDAREFSDRLRTAGGGTPDIPQRPGVRTSEQAGMRVGARTALANMLSGTEQQARRAMDRLAGDRRLQANLRAVLGEDELRELEGIAGRYGFQLNFAEAAKMGSRVVARGDAESLAAALRAQRTVAGPAGTRAGARGTLANALEGSDDDAKKMMERLASDEPYRRRLAQVLSPEEAEQLEKIGAQYGRRLDIMSGVRAGRDVVKQGDTEAFREAVSQAAATPTRAAGVRAGARSAIADAALESPTGATRTAQRLAEDPGLRQRIEAALGAGEAGRLARVGQTTTDAARRMSEAAPASGSLAQARAAEMAEGIQQGISAAVIAAGRYSGAFLANFANSVRQKTSLSRRAAQRLAEMAVDPENAHKVIARLRSAGVDPEDIRRMYREASQVTGIMVGRE